MKIKNWKKVAAVIGAVLVGVVGSGKVWAEEMSGFTLSPMNQKIVLDPGDSYEGSFKISNPGTHTKDIGYYISVQPFYVSDDYTTVFENVENTGTMAEWITLESADKGTLKPNETIEVIFKIDVPEDAPGGGQYASILVATDLNRTEQEENTMMIRETTRIGHLIFAEITGETIRKGEILEANVPGFMFSGNISGTSAIMNTGNTHGTATYKMQVFPLFSDEEVYTNEETPETHTILPNRTFYNTIEWSETPGIGLFNVVYTVEFEGVTAQVKKLVIICPLWLLFMIIFVVVALILYIILKPKYRKRSI